MLETALRLRTPIAVGGYLDVAEAVELPPHPAHTKPNRNVEDLRWGLAGPNRGGLGMLLVHSDPFQEVIDI